MRGHRGEVMALAINAKGLIASSSVDGTVQLWNTFGRGQGKLTPSSAVDCMTMDAGRWLMTGDVEVDACLWAIVKTRKNM